MTKRPDQDLINSLFDAIEQSDINAHTTIEILSETHDLKNLKRHVFLPEEESGEIAQDPLDLYLHSVFYGAQKTLNLLIDIGSNHSSISTMPTNETNIIILQESKSLKTPLPIKNGNDVCWAVLSDDEHALTKLEDAYVQHGLKMDINAREAIPINNFDLNNGDAQKHTPLDLAVMRYIAERRMDIIKILKNKNRCPTP